jgi:predicted nucleic acid-binding protein
MRFLDEIKPNLLIIDFSQDVRDRAEQMFRRRARAHRLSFCDAISFVAVTTLLGRMPCFAFDRDFRALGLTVIS